MNNQNGVIYYNKGLKCIARLAVSIYSLRKLYPGRIRVVTDDDESSLGCDILKNICTTLDAELFITKFPTPEGNKTALLNKTIINTKSPFEVSVFLDADTLIVGPIDELFMWGREHEFVVPQFHDWKTKGKIGKRIKCWEHVFPDKMETALSFGPAINCGVYAWHKDSELMKHWWNQTMKGRDVHRIPDETCLQVILPEYKHYVAPSEFNASCRYGDPFRSNVRIIHYHGNKHCRMNGDKFLNASEAWYKAYLELRDFSFMKEAISFDRMLKKYESTAIRRLSND